MVAQALGFDSTARAVDVLAEAEKRLAENTKELEQARASGSTSDVARLLGDREVLQQAITDLGGAQDRLNASERDWLGVLRQINPSLGLFIDNALKSAKVVKELVAEKKLWSAAAGAAIPILTALAAAAAAVAQEFARGTKAIQDQARALDELKGQERERQQSIDDARAASKLPIFSPDESRVARETADRIGQQFPFIDAAAVNKAVAFAGGAAGEIGGGAFGVSDIARLARLIQLGPESLKLTNEMRPEAVQREIERELARHRERLDQDFATQAAKEAEQRGRATIEAKQVGGSTLGLRERIARRAPEGMDIDFLVRLAQSVPSGQEAETFGKWLDDAISGVRPISNLARRGAQLGSLLGINIGAIEPRLTAEPEHVAVLEGVFQEMLAEQRRATEALRRMESRPSQVVLPDAKFYGADGEAFLRRVSNGESRARNLE
jgi:hypothetical protein